MQESILQTLPSCHDKNSHKLEIEGTYLNLIQSHVTNPEVTSYSMVKPKGFPLRSGKRQGCPLSPLIFNIILEVLARAIRQEKTFKASKLERKK